MKHYANQLTNAKYKVKLLPYIPFNNYLQKRSNDGLRTGDPWHTYKTEFKGYDVVVSNMMNRPYVEFINMDFIREYFAVDRHYMYPKSKIASNAIRRFMGNGLLLS